MTARAHETSAMTYILTWVALVVLAFATYLLAKANLGIFQVPVALVIAVAKGLLVVLIFMHLLEQRSANRIFFLVAFLFIVLVVSLTTADVATRQKMELPRIEPPTAISR